MRRQQKRFALIRSLVIALCVAPALQANERDPQAQAILQQLAEQVQKARTFEVKIKISSTEQQPGSNLTLETEHVLAVSKPDKLAFVTTNGTFGTTVPFQGCNQLNVRLPELQFRGVTFSGNDMAATIISDGKQRYISLPYMLGVPKNQSSGVADVRSDSNLKSYFSVHDIAPYIGHGSCATEVIQQLFLGDPASQSVFDNATELRYVGREDVRGESCHKIKYRFPHNNEWYLFVLATEPPVLREVRLEFVSSGGGSDTHVTRSTVFQDWRIDQPVEPDRFKIPPQDAESKR